MAEAAVNSMEVVSSTKQTQEQTKFGIFANVVDIATKLGVLVGVIVGVFTLINGVISFRENTKADRQRAYEITKTIVSDNTNAQNDEKKFKSKFQGEEGKKKLAQLIATSADVSAAYFSNDLAEMRSLGRHYEELGVLIRNDYLDFDVIYEIIPFPDEFWDETADFRKAARSGNWHNGRPLGDFWKNFSYLHDRYVARRAEDARSSAPRITD